MNTNLKLMKLIILRSSQRNTLFIKSTLKIFSWLIALSFLLHQNLSNAQVNTGGNANTSNHDKQIIGYITNWDAWKQVTAGVPGQGALTHLNIDYSKYTILNYSFFGVANDGSLHSGDLRNKQIHQSGAVQQPGDLLYSDIYSSWDYHILFGEIDPIQHINEAVKLRAEALGYQVTIGGNTWSHQEWGLQGNLPLPLPKEGSDGKGLLELAHQNGVKVMASIGGWSMCKHFPEMAADPVKRERFIQDCKKLISMGFDGIDLDWEYPGPYPGMNFTGTNADYSNFETLVQEIRNAIGPDKLITAAMAADYKKLEGFNWTNLANIMDYFNMMTYDFAGGFSNKAGHNAAVYPYDGAEAPDFNWQSLLNKMTSMGVPSNKINFGIPFYGRGVVTNGNAALNAPTVKRNVTVQPDGPVSTAADYTNWPQDIYDGTPNYFFIKQKTGEGSGWTRHWDDQAKVPYMTKGNFFLSYDDEESIGIKAQYIKDNNLAGTIVWTVYGDLEISGSVQSFGTKLKRWSNVKSPLINKVNEVFANGVITNANPTVSITSPESSEVFTENSNIAITADANDSDGTVTKVEFYNGAIKIGEDTSSPYTYNWKTVSAGNYIIKAKATDNEGDTAISSVSITVTGSGDNELPIVSITSPQAEDTFTAGTNINISASASDNDGTIAKVAFYNGSTLLGEKITVPYTYNWNSVPEGTYTITVKAFDDKNGEGSSSVSIIVNSSTGGSCTSPAYVPGQVYTGGDMVSYQGNEYKAKWWTQNNDPVTNNENVWELTGPCSGGGSGSAPQVSITSPTSGTNITTGSSIIINASASDSDGSVSKVEFYNGTIKLGEDVTSPYSYTWNNAANGSYSLTAVATDNDATTNTSTAVNITVSTNTGGDCDATAYADGSAYNTGDIVQNFGKKYECIVGGWCSAGGPYAPGDPDGWAWPNAWKEIGDCSGGSGTFTVSITQPTTGSSFTVGQSVNIAVNANDTNGSISKVVFYVDGNMIGEDLSTPYSANWIATSGSHTLTAQAINDANTTVDSTPVNVTVGSINPPSGGDLPKRILVGYWHNFNNPAGTMKLSEISDKWDVINISFAVPTVSIGSTMTFTPDPGIYASKQEFKNDVAALQSKGKKVLISMGGETGVVGVNTPADAQAFSNSMINIIREYGFDGMDIDFEGQSISLAAGDTDLKNPTSPKVVNLISAFRTIISQFNSDFILSMAPETLYVQGGFSSYGGPAGAYLPLIYALRNDMDYIHVQHYNTGCMLGLDGLCYSSANADFHVAMADMLLQGFPVAGGQQFPALRQEQVAIGLPATTSAAGSGYTTPAEVHKALDYIIKGQSFGGRYTLRNPSGYSDFRGLMTWSINWDKASGFGFSNPHRTYLDASNNVRIGHIETIDNVNVHPNPVVGDLMNVTINASIANSDFNLQIFNTSGIKVLDNNSSLRQKGNNQKSFNVSRLQEGLYFYIISLPNEEVRGKVMIKR